MGCMGTVFPLANNPGNEQVLLGQGEKATG